VSDPVIYAEDLFLKRMFKALWDSYEPITDADVWEEEIKD